MAYSILIVDDDEDIRSLLEFHLEKKKFDVDSADDAKSAQKKMLKKRPDVALIDVMMPDINGIDLCKWIVAQPSLQDLPMIMISALEDEATVQASMKIGAMGYITKPIDIKVLDNQIELALKRSERRKEIEGK